VILSRLKIERLLASRAVQWKWLDAATQIEEVEL
jgi:hypothetical protein